jgi:peptidoglycan hydrolase-like protein with peptidoglycan-binding domain
MTARRRGVIGLLVATGVAALAAVAVVVVVSFVVAKPADTAPIGAPPGATTEVTVQTLVETISVTGELGYGQTEPIESKAAGTVTWLPDVGTVLRQGDTVVRVDETPVVLLNGALPMYRPLALNTEGTDVEQFETSLRALGYEGFTVDEKYTEATVKAVTRWQRRLGVAETGTVEISSVVYIAGAVRVASHTARLGGDAAGEILTYTADTKVVRVDVPTTNAAWAVAGATVTVALPDGTTVAGAVAEVGTEATAESSDGSADSAEGATVSVTIAVADQAAFGRLDRAPVEVRYIARQRPDVLTVPVAALLAPIEGGYALEVVNGTRTRIVAVRTGLFADGRVEVSGEGIVAGTVVRVPE